MTKLDFDSYASQLHVSGRVAEENKHVKLGSYHTLDLELQRNFTLEKADGWDSIAIDTLKEAINQDAKAQLWAVVLQEGLANICLVTDHQTILRQRIEVNMPKKRAGSSDHDKALQRFFQTTFDTVLRQIDLSDPKPLLLASPGFTASSLQQFIKTKASESSDKDLKQLIPKITVAHSASGHLHSLAEVLSSPAVTSKLSDTKFARETQLMDRFFELLRKDDALDQQKYPTTKHGQLELFESIIVVGQQLLPFYDLPGRSPKPDSSACGFALELERMTPPVSQ